MAHKKVIRSAVYLHPLTDLHPSLDAREPVLGAVQRCLEAEAVELACLWDAAALLVKSYKEEAAAEAEPEAADMIAGRDEADHAEQSEARQAEQRARLSEVCRSAFLQVCFLPHILNSYCVIDMLAFS